MALLYRFTKLNDRYNTGIFTFIVTRSVTRDIHRDATTKDFYYGYHRWAISFTRANENKALGVFLILRNPSPSTKCYADFTLTLLNREHFSRNEQHTEKQCKFTAEHTTQGLNKWILMSEIQTRKFGDETGEFLLELSLGNIMTIFETDLQVSNNGQFKSGKFESASFTFGSFEWNVSIVIHNYGSGSAIQAQQNDTSNSSQNRIIYVFLNRLSGFDHPCRVQYRVTIGDDKNREDSGVLDQISDAGGRIRGFQMQHSLSDLIKPNGAARVYVELHCCNAISEAKVPIVRNPSPTINCYDRNKQGWCIEADLDSEYLRLKLFFMDLHSVPRNHLRYISWIAYVIAKDPRHGIRESLAVSNSPHSNYYVQDGIDMGAMMDTTLPVAKIKESPKMYLESEKLTVHVEWCDSIMLFNHIYHKYDDITRIHGHQMRREILALSSENYSLEKQLISYQKTIGHNNVSRALVKENSSESGSIKGHHHHHHHHKPSRRSSSDLQFNDEAIASATALVGNLPSGQSQSNVLMQQQHSQSKHRAEIIDGSSIGAAASSKEQILTVMAPGTGPSVPGNINNNQTAAGMPLVANNNQQLITNTAQTTPIRHRSSDLGHYHHHHHKLPQIPTTGKTATSGTSSPLAGQQCINNANSSSIPIDNAIFSIVSAHKIRFKHQIQKALLNNNPANTNVQTQAQTQAQSANQAQPPPAQNQPPIETYFYNKDDYDISRLATGVNNLTSTSPQPPDRASLSGVRNISQSTTSLLQHSYSQPHPYSSHHHLHSATHHSHHHHLTRGHGSQDRLYSGSTSSQSSMAMSLPTGATSYLVEHHHLQPKQHSHVPHQQQMLAKNTDYRTSLTPPPGQLLFRNNNYPYGRLTNQLMANNNTNDGVGVIGGASTATAMAMELTANENFQANNSANGWPLVNNELTPAAVNEKLITYGSNYYT